MKIDLQIDLRRVYGCMTLACILRQQSDERQTPGSTPDYNKVSIDRAAGICSDRFSILPDQRSLPRFYQSLKILVYITTQT